MMYRILVALLMFSMAMAVNLDDPNFDKGCVAEQIMKPNVTYYVYSFDYPKFFAGARRCKFTGRLPKNNQISRKYGYIKLSCSDIDHGDWGRWGQGDCKKNNVIKISEHELCGRATYQFIYDRSVWIDWIATDTSRSRFSCALTAFYKLRKNASVIFSPSDFSTEPPPEPIEPPPLQLVNLPQCTCGMTFGCKGESEIKSNQYPFMAGLVDYTISTSDFFCAASIISDRYALTAAQCIDILENLFDGLIKREKSPVVTERLRLVVGDQQKTYSRDGHVIYDVESLKPHDKWSPKDINLYDIMIIKTAKIINFRYGIRSVCLPYTTEDHHLYSPTIIGKILGWGIEKYDNKPAEVLKEDIVTSFENCTVYEPRCKTQNHMRDWHLEQNHSTIGNIGSPLIWYNKTNNRNVLIGILTKISEIPEGNEDKGRDSFTLVKKYLEWIMRHTRVACSFEYLE